MASKPTLTKEPDADVWVLRVETNGKTQEFRCATERQARSLAQLLSRPETQPQPQP